jgi:hypothetical protein
MKKSREEVQRLKDEALAKLRQPPTPLYQKIVILILVVGALFAVLAVLFFR